MCAFQRRATKQTSDQPVAERPERGEASSRIFEFPASVTRLPRSAEQRGACLFPVPLITACITDPTLARGMCQEQRFFSDLR